jgi:membrane carboxypeptidase/penicillin-binding protein
MRSEARTIIRVYDSKRRIWTENPPSISPVLSPASAFITTMMLKDVLTYGTAKSLRKFSQAHPSAGKTGTTDNYRDAWFVGYTPQVITGVWVGYDRPHPGGKGFTGGAVAAPIWERFMLKAVATKPAVDFTRPDSVVSLSIDPATGCPATEVSPKRRDEFYIVGTEPGEFCPKRGETAVKPLPAPLPLPDTDVQQPEPSSDGIPRGEKE